ncbi:hypothetical protein ACFVYC_00045 [Pseudarthrobacter sp. NPDC058329]|uniref:hypothetical protein n=1 Tax=Pseudarthrobacter sp. NPDC058329 TaxID=3346448 RepID=UPI0036DB7FA7
MSVFMSVEAAQSALHVGGRFLLMVSMMLFLAYALFMIGAVVVSGLLNTTRSVRRRLVYSRPAATGVPQSATPMRQVGSTAKRHEARV